MSAVTVRSMLAMILENNLQMDDEIHFSLSEETKDNFNEKWWEIDFVSTEVHSIVGEKSKQLVMMFDLNMIDGECDD